MQELNGIWRFIVDELELPAEEVLQVPLVRMAGDYGVVLENHTGIHTLGEDEVRFACKKGELCIEGKNLTLRELSSDSAIIRGRISAVYFKSLRK